MANEKLERLEEDPGEELSEDQLESVAGGQLSFEQCGDRIDVIIDPEAN